MQTISIEPFFLARSLTQLSCSPGNLPLEDAFRSARVYTFPRPGGRRPSLADSGGFQTVTPPAGVGPAQRPSLRSGPRRLRGPGAHYKSQKATLRRGPAAALPAASLVLRLLPLSPSPVPVGLLSTVNGYFLLKHMRGSLSHLDIEVLRVLALSPSARTMPDSLTGVG